MAGLSVHIYPRLLYLTTNFWACSWQKSWDVVVVSRCLCLCPPSCAFLIIFFSNDLFPESSTCYMQCSWNVWRLFHSVLDVFCSADRCAFYRLTLSSLNCPEMLWCPLVSLTGLEVKRVWVEVTVTTCLAHQTVGMRPGPWRVLTINVIH
jgi:hypothetical protein